MEEVAEFFRDVWGEYGAAFDELAIIFQASGEEAGAGVFDRAGKIFEASVVETEGNATGDCHFAGVAEDAEAGDVGDGVERGWAVCAGLGALWTAGSPVVAVGRYEFEEGFGGVFVEAGHGVRGGLDGFFAGLALFQGCGDYAGADGFCEEENVAGSRAKVAPDFIGMDEAGDGVTEFWFVIADGVAAEDCAIGFAHFVEAAAHDLFEDFEGSGGRKRDDGEGGDGAAAHGVDVAEGVGGGDLAEEIWIVDERREEVDRLDEGDVVGDSI